MSSPSPPAGCLSSRPGKRITTRGTNGVVGAVALHPSVVRARPPGQAHTFAIATRRCIGHETPLLPGRLRPGRFAATVTADRVASTLWEFAPRSACARPGSGTFGAGTIIHRRNAPPTPCGHSCASPGPREGERHRFISGCGKPVCLSGFTGSGPLQPPTTGHRLPSTSFPPGCAYLRSGLNSGAFKTLTGSPAASTDGPEASGNMPHGTERSTVGFDVSVGGFLEQGRQVSSSTRL